MAAVLPIPKEFRGEGVWRYGFHGLSCQSIVHQLGRDLPERLVIAHPGSGASTTAVRGGRSIEISMGLTPSGGIVMASRSGNLDPSLLLYLMRERGMDATCIEDMVDRRLGLFGISGVSGDLRKLHAAAATNADAALAISVFCRSVAKQTAAMMASLGGADMIVFTGGIGENDAVVRSTICADLGWAAVSMDSAATNGRVIVRVLPFLEGAEWPELSLPSQRCERLSLDEGDKLRVDPAVYLNAPCSAKLNERLKLERVKRSRMATSVKDIGHRQMYDILQSRKPRVTGGELWGFRVWP